MTYEQYQYNEYQRYAAQHDEDAVDIDDFILLLKYFEETVDAEHDKV